jgi:hypothetical protein
VGFESPWAQTAILEPALARLGHELKITWAACLMALITIGFAAVPSLIEKRVDAVPAFWNVRFGILQERPDVDPGVEIRKRLRRPLRPDAGLLLLHAARALGQPEVLERRNAAEIPDQRAHEPRGRLR